MDTPRIEADGPLVNEGLCEDGVAEEDSPWPIVQLEPEGTVVAVLLGNRAHLQQVVWRVRVERTLGVDAAVDGHPVVPRDHQRERFDGLVAGGRQSGLGGPADEFLLVVATDTDGVLSGPDELDDLVAGRPLPDEVTDKHDAVVAAGVQSLPQLLQFGETAMDVSDHVDVLDGRGIEACVSRGDRRCELWSSCHQNSSRALLLVCCIKVSCAPTGFSPSGLRWT